MTISIAFEALRTLDEIITERIIGERLEVPSNTFSITQYSYSDSYPFSSMQGDKVHGFDQISQITLNILNYLQARRRHPLLQPPSP